VIELDDSGFGFVDAMLEEAGDRDVFEVTLDSAGTVEIELFSWTGDLDTYLYVYDVDCNLIAENDDDDSWTDSAVSLDLPAGTYYASAASFDDGETGEYGLDVYFTPTGVSDPDPDPNPEPGDDDHADVPGPEATEIWFGQGGFGMELGSLESPVDHDVFQFVIDEGGITTVMANRLDEELDTTLAILDTNGDLIDQNDDFAGTTDSQLSLNLEPGVYYASIAASDDASVGDYVVKVVAPGLGWGDIADADLPDETEDIDDEPWDEFEDPWGDLDDMEGLEDPSDELDDSEGIWEESEGPWDEYGDTDWSGDPWDEFGEIDDSEGIWEESEGPWGDYEDADGSSDPCWGEFDSEGFWDEPEDPWGDYEDADGADDSWGEVGAIDETDGYWDESEDEFGWTHFDINDDRLVSPMDVLGIINYLNSSSASRSIDVASQREDVNGDGTVSPMDVLMVINYLNAPATEASPSPAGGEYNRSASGQLTTLASGEVAYDSSTGGVLSLRTSELDRDSADSASYRGVVDRGEDVATAESRSDRSSRSADVDLAMASDADWLAERWADVLPSGIA